MRNDEANQSAADGDIIGDMLDPESTTELLSIFREHGFVPPKPSA